MPPAMTAMVPPARAPLCAAASMPRASPEMTTCLAAEVLGERLGKPLSVDRGIARTNHGNARPAEKVNRSLRRQDRRCIVELRKAGRIALPALEQQPCAGAFVGSKFGFGSSAGGGFQGSAATARQVRYRAKRFDGTAVALEQQAEGHGSDIRGPYQPKAGNLFVAFHTAGIRQ